MKLGSQFPGPPIYTVINQGFGNTQTPVTQALPSAHAALKHPSEHSPRLPVCVFVSGSTLITNSLRAGPMAPYGCFNTKQLAYARSTRREIC